jgi:plastocyanin domain-containing protein
MTAAVSLVLSLAALTLASSCEKKDTSLESAPSASGSAWVAAGSGARVTIGEHGFAPSSLTLQKGPEGSTAAITFLRTTDETCAKEVVFPDLAVKKDLPLNTPVTIDVPIGAPRTLTFQCGMAMYKGAVVVK